MPTVNRYDCLFFKERGSNLPRRVTFGLLPLSKSPRGHVVFHHGTFLQLVPNRVCMIGAGCLEKVLDVISGLPRLALEVVLNSGNELLIGVTDLLVIVPSSQLVVIVTHWGHRFSPFLLPLVLLFAPLPAVLSGAPRPLPRGTFLFSWTKMALTTSSAKACLVYHWSQPSSCTRVW
jgi:hypothetical protein